MSQFWWFTMHFFGQFLHVFRWWYAHFFAGVTFFLFLAFLELGQLYLSDPTIPLSEHFKSATLGLRDSKKTSSHQKWVVFEVMGVPQVSEHWMVSGTFLDFLHLFLWMRNMRTNWRYPRPDYTSIFFPPAINFSARPAMRIPLIACPPELLGRKKSSSFASQGSSRGW